MKIALIGATGMIGKRILEEALARGHEVTAVVRDPSRTVSKSGKVNMVVGNIFDVESLVHAIAGHDVVISAFGPKRGEEETLMDATHSLISAVKRAGVPRLLAVGGAGSLEVASGVQLVDTPEFPDFIKPIALAHRDALEIYRQETELNWTNVSPAAMIEPGERTGTYRTGIDQLVVNEKGESRISAEDYAVAMLDEVENPRFSRMRFTVAY